MKSNERVAIIDYGIGNLFSVNKAFARIGINSFVTSDVREILNSTRVVLPGVGAFKNGMQKLIEAELVSVVKDLADSGKPLLGICLGAQLLLESSEEFETTAGLGIIKGKVIEIPNQSRTEDNIRVPHIGWNNLVFPGGVTSTKGTILDSIPQKSMTYFVHSFMMSPDDPANRLADVDYHGVNISAAIKSKNVSGTQFHPEKSADIGLQILRNFCES
ncbi:glutamine amidotransferase [Candidatus Planktophila dulcis]|uniref:Imidazole glycerol phosphate synthase subunit HisH n=1 Tax=Candidatus Planktophila dulcis TaxID=1884914 RepID=A0AAC9YS54_9ACTN|nr:imidazole glycerol phosphate synthase subunit HisH [Candidatus Planktophila dulcis]ASY11440.1 glutamine amidotransferase [Candidatus Planktophila dulcis]